MTEAQPDDRLTPATRRPPPAATAARSWRSVLASTEIDTRLFGMVIALAVIWIAFNILSGGDFLTARNLWNLSVQSTSIAIMATGMVLIIVSRNIDLSVGSLLGFLGYTMALVQTDGVIAFFGIDVTIGGLRDSSYVWVVALAVGVVLGAAGRRRDRASSSPTAGCPSFIVTLGGFLVWRGMIFRTGGKQGQTLAPLERDVPAARRRAEGLARRVAELAARARSAAPAIVLSHLPRRGAAGSATTSPSGRCGSTSGSASSAARPCSPASGWSPTATPRRSPGTRPGVAYPVVILIVVTVADDLPRPAAPLRPLRVRIRRQPRGRRARRHQHPPHGHADVRPHGRARARSAPRSRRPGSTLRSPTSACRTSSTSSPPPSSAARRSPAASARSPAPCSARSSCSRCARAWCC